MRLRGALLGLFAALYVPLLLLGTALLIHQWDEQRDQALQQVREQTASLLAAVERETALDLAVLNTLASLPEFDREDWADLHATAKAAATSRPGSWIAVIDRDGQYVVNTRVPFGTPLPNLRTMPARPAHAEWRGRQIPSPPWRDFEQRMEAAKPFLSGLIYGAVIQGPVVAINVPVVREGKARYVVSMAYGPEFFVRMLEAQAAVDGLLRVIFDRSGLVLARSVGSESFIGRPVAAPLNQGLDHRPAEGVGETVSLEGLPVFYAYGRVQSNGWGVSVAVPRDRVLAPARREQAIWITALIGAALLGALWAVRLWRALAIPLAALARQARSADGPPAESPPARIEEVEVLRQAMLEAAQGQQLRRQTELERERAERRFRLVVESSPIGKLMVDVAGTITLVNRRVEEQFGYGRDELLGQAVELLVPQSLRAGHVASRSDYAAARESRAMAAGRPLLGRRKDGSEFPIEVWLVAIETSEGSFTLASVLDISERKRVEDELRRSNQDLEQFAYIASHDLQEPLRMVSSYTELLAKRYRGQLDEKADKYIFYAVDGAQRMRGLITDLLAFSRVGSQAKPLLVVDAARVVAEVVQLMKGTIHDAGARIEYADLPSVLADKGQLAQVFQNLIGNAIKFRSGQPAHIVIDARLADGFWEFCVKDNGIGFEPQYAERIFMMFQRLHERGTYAGSGIGLAIVKRIVERHGGRVWAESRLGGGTTIRFTLRARPGEPDPPRTT